MGVRDWLLGLFGRRARQAEGQPRARGPAIHVIILDGTMSTLRRGYETNAGLTYKLLRESGRQANLTVHYEAGIQWPSWSETLDVMMGRGINRQIQRAYGVLASRFRPGDRIVLVGYSRGAYAVRSLAGVVSRVGLLRAEEATERNVRDAYRHYRHRGEAPSEAARAFARLHCHDRVDIEAVGCWDTVASLGLRLPLLWRLSEPNHMFHDHRLGRHVLHGFHALALDETREGYAPVLWTTPDAFEGHVEQVWFRGTHGDIGGQLNGEFAARPLANIPLVWMLTRLEACGLPLPADWEARFPCDPDAPSVGTWRGWGKMFLLRGRRVIGRDPSERLHDSVAGGHRARRLLPGSAPAPEPEIPGPPVGLGAAE
ncbi:DUF2235 domain-containing protein [Limimaricola pyoseonensis]|uniref:Uncharacterized alpha/beta hydrolase domain n=1 Tax=Limimaricola pyoseonensis TaxID=521013 RepID=A0A1G7D425_9RHOB|nr:DUF2235 domain-containing protein [Limimaricola pyoseonensis]SDE45760.1 Uncharacterized alpha/beta hydrolase domain [Limimaricola pyoseonensis]